ncbi:HLA class II histocompatibility antigen gamma chain isoform X2 [Lissotriton helveticus]
MRRLHFHFPPHCVSVDPPKVSAAAHNLRASSARIARTRVTGPAQTMAEERQDLLANQEMPSVVGGEPAPRGVSCGRGTIMSVLSVFVGLLLAGQVATVYFVAQQHGQITKLKDFNTEMKLKMLSDQLAKSHPSPHKKMQMAMAMASMPLAFADTDERPFKVNLTKLENTAKRSNKIEDHVKYIVAKDNPQAILPELNDTYLENLNKLKGSMNDAEWKNPLQKESKADEEEQSPITEAPVFTKCQLEATGRGVHSPLLGACLPECAESGEYLPKQCCHSTGFCSCVYKNGTKIPGTSTRGQLDCSFLDREGSTVGWMMEDNLQESTLE